MLCNLHAYTPLHPHTHLHTLHPHLHTGLLLSAQLHNASQLSSWCLDFISSNYAAFVDSDGFAQLEGDNLSHVQEHRWPPLSYETAMDEYKRNYLDTEGEGSGWWGVEPFVCVYMHPVQQFGVCIIINHLFTCDPAPSVAIGDTKSTEGAVAQSSKKSRLSQLFKRHK